MFRGGHQLQKGAFQLEIHNTIPPDSKGQPKANNRLIKWVNGWVDMVDREKSNLQRDKWLLKWKMRKINWAYSS